MLDHYRFRYSNNHPTSSRANKQNLDSSITGKSLSYFNFHQKVNSKDEAFNQRMTIASMSTQRAAIAYLFFLAVSLANAAIINRSGDDENNVDDIDDAIPEMSIIIDDGNDAKVVAFYDALKEILIAPTEPNEPMALPVRKRTCYFNAGMSHSCDYNEVLKTVDDVNHWSSDYTPGRRRKRQHSTTRRGRVPTRSLDGRSIF